jgi:hypothetical protein
VRAHDLRSQSQASSPHRTFDPMRGDADVSGGHDSLIARSSRGVPNMDMTGSRFTHGG